jgi:hypothetical protein
MPERVSRLLRQLAFLAGALSLTVDAGLLALLVN